MATVEITSATPDHPKHTVTIQTTEKIALCRCWHSQKFPFCDGSHRDHPGQGPAVVIVAAPAAPQEK